MRGPESTTCCGELSFAIESPCGVGDLSSALGSVGAEQRDHAAVPGGLARLLHQSAAQRDELEPVALAEHAGSDQGAELAERVAGGELLAGRPSAHQPAMLAQKIAGCAKAVPSSTRRNGSSPTTSIASLSRSGRTRATVVAHIRRLAALSGEEKSGGHVPLPYASARIRVRVTLGAPRSGGEGSGRATAAQRHEPSRQRSAGFCSQGACESQSSATGAPATAPLM